MGRGREMSISTAVLVMVAVMAAAVAEAQTPDCVMKLVACGEFLKSDNPPASCCDPIKETVKTQLDCLCNIYTSPDFLPSINVNLTDAIHLTKACGVPVDTSKCKSSTAGPRRGSSPAAPGNDADRLALAGFSSILMFLAALILILH